MITTLIGFMLAMWVLVALTGFRPARTPGKRTRKQGLLEGAQVGELVKTFIPGCYLVNGSLGSGKSYISTRIGGTLAAALELPLRANYPFEPELRYALAQQGMMLPVNLRDPEHKWNEVTVSMKADDPRWSEPGVFIVDEALYYWEAANLRKLFLERLVHARHRGQIVFVLSQGPLSYRIKFLWRYVLRCRFWIPIKLFRVDLIDPQVTKRQHVLRTFSVPLSLWWSRSYNSWFDFATVAEALGVSTDADEPTSNNRRKRKPAAQA